jgi:hypothetical protein
MARLALTIGVKWRLFICVMLFMALRLLRLKWKPKLMSKTAGKGLSLMTRLFRLFVTVLAAASPSQLKAQTYTQMQWGMNKGVTPYQFGANINGTWRVLGSVTSGGVWQIPTSSLYYYRTGTATDQLGRNYTAGVMALGANNFNINTPLANSENIAYGVSVLTNLTTGFQNIAFGNWALASLTTGYGNLAIGQQVMQGSTTGVFNTGVGTAVMRYLDDTAAPTTGNVALGHGAMGGDDWGYYALTGSGNTSLGSWSMQELTAGARNVAVGMNAGMNIQDGNDNVAIGFSTQVCSFDAYNTRVPGGCSATANIAIGSNALQTNKATGNIGIGYFALNNNTTGDNNIGIGLNALKSTTTAQGNLAIGNLALQQMTSGGFNVGLGGYTLFAAGAKSYNVAIGWGSGQGMTTGNGNVAVGFASLNNTVTGANNTVIGAYAGQSVTNQINTTSIGFQAEPTKNNQVVLGNSSVTEVKTSGVVVAAGATLSGPLQLAQYTVATLPTCNAGSQGQLVYVSDSTPPTYDGLATGGGVYKVPVFCNGANWLNH